MENLAIYGAVLGCGLMMAAMMWMMNRGSNRGDAAAPGQDGRARDEIRALREEVESLRASSSESTAATPAKTES